MINNFQTILVAGGTGNLGKLIVKALIKRGAGVRVVVRPETDPKKIKTLNDFGAETVAAEMAEANDLKRACQGVSCVVSALSGLRETIIDAQTQLLDAAIAAGVPRFIPSDFSSDFTGLSTGENRNFDLRKEFHETLDKSPIRSTSIFNGAFSYVLSYNSPLFDLKNHSAGYLGTDPDWKIDFSTMENTADYTAAAALDSETPRVLRIAGFQVSPKDLAAIGEQITDRKFKLISLGSLDEFAAAIKKDRAAQPASETELFPEWQIKQYQHAMFSVRHETLDNNRYADVRWTGAKEAISNF